MEQQHKLFEDYCRDKYGGFGTDNDGCPRSKAVTKAKGERIVKILQGACIESDTLQFRHWIKQRRFKLVTHSALGFKDVLCIPAKTKVSN